VNTTPDSFFADSRTEVFASALTRSQQLLKEGADVLDIGGESTRPGAIAVSLEEERKRVIPLVEELVLKCPTVPLSIDTQKAAIAHEALEKGASWINDVSALQSDPEMASVVAQYHCPVVLMHRQGTSETMQQNPRYTHVIDEVNAFFEERIRWSVEQGIAEEKIILDPGIGFGKTVEHNVLLLQQLHSFLQWGKPLLIGVSRKTFLGHLISSGSEIPGPDQRLEASLSAALWALSQGAIWLRVHDVAATRKACDVWTSLQGKMT